VKWKTQLIISGHMHQTAWIPGTEEFPYAQMVGGGPQPTRATWMEVSADAQKLAVLVKNLNGKVVEQAAFPPLT
jgi:hypothetical protein